MWQTNFPCDNYDKFKIYTRAMQCFTLLSNIVNVPHFFSLLPDLETRILEEQLIIL